MKFPGMIAACLTVCAAFAEKQPFERYQPILDRQMFGRPPIGFDPTKPPSEVSKSEQRELTREQETLKSAIHFSMINVTPDGETAVGFTDNSAPGGPVHYYLKVGEKRNGWEVKEADPVKATMTIAKGDLVVPLELGSNSAAAPKAGAAGAAPAAGVAPVAAGRTGLAPRAPLLGGGAPANGAAPGMLRRPSSGGDSVRARRAAAAAEREAAAAAAAEREKAAAAEREQEREAHLQELQSIKDELKSQAAALAREKAAREAEAARKEKPREPKEEGSSDAGDES